MTFRYNSTKQDGTTCCGGNDEEFPRCEHCKDAIEQDDYTPVDSYAADTAKRREREATPESRFADQYKAARLRELAIEYAEQEATK